MANFASLAHQCVVRPQWKLMQKAYDAYWSDRKPCKGRIEGRSIENQCAVRMSIALERCGFSLRGFGHLRDRNNHRRVHRSRRGCQVQVPHVLGAEELARYLDAAIGFNDDFRRRTLDDAAASLAGRPGIVYFNNCFTRRGDSSRRGDHIDLWDGNETYNQKQGGSTAAEGPDTGLFGNADRIKFMPLL
jgi:hypothetical protein